MLINLATLVMISSSMLPKGDTGALVATAKLKIWPGWFWWGSGFSREAHNSDAGGGEGMWKSSSPLWDNPWDLQLQQTCVQQAHSVAFKSWQRELCGCLVN